MNKYIHVKRSDEFGSYTIPLTGKDVQTEFDRYEARIACLTARQAELEAKIERAKACGACADFVLDEEGE